MHFLATSRSISEMTLAEWVGKNGRADARRLLARALRCSEVAVRSYCNGIRRVPPGRCHDIERETGGEVTCEELRPDVFRKPRRKAA